MNIIEAKKALNDIKFCCGNSNTLEYLHSDRSYGIFEYSKLFDLITGKEIISKVRKDASWLGLITEHNGRILLHKEDLCWINIVKKKNLLWNSENFN